MQTEPRYRVPGVSRDADCVSRIALRLLRDGTREHHSRVGLVVYEHWAAHGARDLSRAGQLREVATPKAEQYWSFLECLLEVADSSMTYRTRYYTTLQPLAVLDVLLADPDQSAGTGLPGEPPGDLYERLPRHLDDDLQAIRDALARLRSFDLRELKYPLPGATAAANDFDGLSRLERFLRELGVLLPSWSNNLSEQVLQPCSNVADYRGPDIS